MMRDGFTYATEPDKNGQVTIVEYGRDPETGRMQVVSAMQKTVRSYAGGGMTQSGIERILAQSGRSRPNPMYNAPQVEGPEVTAPMVWKSAPDHPPTMLAYITPQEAELLSAADIHNSGVSMERHYGPRGIPSFNGDGGGGSEGASGTGGSDTGSGGFDGSDAAVSASSYGGAYGGLGYGGAGPAGLGDAMSGAPANEESLQEQGPPAPPSVQAQTSMLDALNDGIPAGSQGLAPGARADSIGQAAVDAAQAYSKSGDEAMAGAMRDMADVAFGQAMEAGYGQKGERTFDITNAWGNSLLDNLAYGGLGVAVPAAALSAIRNAMENPIATAINTVVGIVAGPVGLANTVSGLLGGPTIGSVATAAGRSVGESLGLSNEGTPESVAQGIGPSPGIASLAESLSSGIGPAKGDYGDLGGYGGGSSTTEVSPPPLPEVSPEVLPTAPPAAPPSLSIGKPGGRPTTSTLPTTPTMPSYNPVVASTMPFFAPTQASGSGMSPLLPFYTSQTPASIFTPPPIQGYGIASLPGYGQGPVVNPFALV